MCRYYEFKPGKVYWKVYVIVRKFLIAFAGLMFRGNVTFMLAFVCLTLIICYVLQARCVAVVVCSPQRHIMYLSIRSLYL